MWGITIIKNRRGIIDLAKKDSSKKKTKDLFDDLTFIESTSCKSSVEDQIFYNHKNESFALIQKYLGEIINLTVFISPFI